MTPKVFIILIVVLIASVGMYFVWFEKHTLYFPNNPTEIIPNNPTEIIAGPITERGVITCIPKIGTGPQTMECALGLKNTEGIYYGLRYLSDYDENFTLVSHEIIVEITGTLIGEEMFGPDGKKYDTAGTIEIESISEIEN